VRLRLTIVFGILVTGMLAGCAAAGTGAPAGEGAHPAPRGTQNSGTADDGIREDPAAVAKAEAWLAGAVLPPGTVRSDGVPVTPVGFGTTQTGWLCNPTVRRTGYWTLAGATVVDTRNWLSTHPTANLITTSGPIPDDREADQARVGDFPFRGSLEGIAYTVARTTDGVAIRAEIGVVPQNSVCPTPPPGGTFGGPGEG
jgi:hypothetical protein